MPTVMVSGCFDLLHSGHVAFLTSAAEYGNLYVAIGSDCTIAQLKGKPPENNEEERLFLIKSLRCVKEAFLSRGSGILDFQRELIDLRPDIFVVNEDGHHPNKETLCRKVGVQYRIEKRMPAPGLSERSTTELRATCRLPYRIDLAGGWLDQPFVSQHSPGPVIVASVEPDHVFATRSGMATSTRSTAAALWGTRLPCGDLIHSARTLFACENPPGTTVISGSQDALGIVLPGINRLYYQGNYWPDEVESIRDIEKAAWLESLISLQKIRARPDEFDVFVESCVTDEAARRLSGAAEDCWRAINSGDAVALGDAVRQSFEAQIEMFPAMNTPQVQRLLSDLPAGTLGYKLTGSGGGGYLLCISMRPIPDGLRVRIRRSAY